MADPIRTAVWLALFILGVVLSAVQLGGDKAHFLGHGHASDGKLDDRQADRGHGADPPAAHDHGAQHRPLRLFHWEPEAAHTLILRAQDGREQAYVRTAEGWQLAGSRADMNGRPSSDSQEFSFDPEEYVSLLSQARRDREFAADEDALASYGLAPAEFNVRIEDRSGAVLADMNVGSLTPDGFGRYVRMPSNTNVLIVPNYQFEKAIAALVE